MEGQIDLEDGISQAVHLTQQQNFTPSFHELHVIW